MSLWDCLSRHWTLTRTLGCLVRCRDHYKEILRARMPDRLSSQCTACTSISYTVLCTLVFIFFIGGAFLYRDLGWYPPLLIFIVMVVVLARAKANKLVSMVIATCSGAAAVRPGQQRAAFVKAIFRACTLLLLLLILRTSGHGHILLGCCSSVRCRVVP